MIVRQYKESDLDRLIELNEQQDFKLSTIKNRIWDCIIEQDNKIIAYGIVKPMAEAIILLDLKAPKISRARAGRQFLLDAQIAARKVGCEQLHVFNSDEKLSQMQEEHFGFIRTKSIVLAKDL